MKKIIIIFGLILLIKLLNAQVIYLSGEIKQIDNKKVVLSDLNVFEGDYKKDEITINFTSNFPFDSIFSIRPLKKYKKTYLLIYCKSEIKGYTLYKYNKKKGFTPNGKTLCLLIDTLLLKGKYKNYSISGIIYQIDDFYYTLKYIDEGEEDYSSLLNFLDNKNPDFIANKALDLYLKNALPTRINEDLISYRYNYDIPLHRRYFIDKSYNFSLDYDNTDKLVKFYEELLKSGNSEYEQYAKSKINSITIELKGKVEEEKEILNKLSLDKKNNFNH